ncbi:MAG TPA: fibronectin type III domain-containing protein [Candidatus Solibacter sp.]|nr:fibronectin type III domain-containing protein [Candidatus Solibacter sp.]
MELQGLSAGAPTLKDGIVTYANVAPGTDLTYRVDPGGIKESFVLRSASSPTQFNFHISDKLGQLGKAVPGKDGGYTFSNKLDGQTLSLSPAFAIEKPASPRVPVGHDPRSAHLQLTPSGDGFDVVLSVDQSWLRGKSYPIILDPSISVGPTTDAYDWCDTRYGTCPYQGGNTGGNQWAMTNTDVYDTMGTWSYAEPSRDWFQFDVSSVPYNASIQSATFGVFQVYCIGTDSTDYCLNYSNQVDAHRINASWNTGYSFNGASQYMDPGIIDSQVQPIHSCRPLPCADNIWEYYNFTNQVQRWVNGTDANNGFLLTIQYDTTPNRGGPSFASSRNGNAAARPYLSVTYITPPSAPTNVQATGGDGQATVTWAPPSDNGGSAITSYTVSAPGAGTQTVTGTSASFTGLTNCTTYNFSVYATNAAGPGSSASASATPGTVPTSPSNVQATASESSAELTWTAPTGGCPATGYVITPYFKGLAQPSTSVGSSATSYSVVGLTDGTTYQFRVAGTNAIGTGSQSSMSNGVTPPGAASSPFQGCAGSSLISAGGYHTLALKADGTVWAWGQNTYGQLGAPTATTSNSNTPILVAGTANITAVASGFYHSLALNSSGQVLAWGYNVYGQLGQPTSTTTNSTPTVVSGLPTIKAIAAGFEHSLAIDTTGRVWAWGYNPYGGLGNNTTTNSATPVQVGALPAGAVAVAGGAYHSVALLTNGQVFAWGYNGHGELGTGDLSNRYLPVQTAGVHAAAAIAAGFYASYAVQTDGSIWASGFAAEGQLGNATYTSSNAPTKVVGISGQAARVSAGGYSSLALSTQGAVYGYGYNNYGQLGDTTTTNQASAVPSNGLTAGATTSGLYHAAALKPDGSVWTWGYNVDGELGRGTTGGSNGTPTSITGFIGVQAPTAPLTPSATSGNAQATVSWTAPLSNGGSSIVQYVITPSANGVPQSPVYTNSTATSYTVTGLTNGASYTFTVAAQNCAGTGSASLATSAVTPDVVPNAPGTPVAAPGNAQVGLTWTAPPSNGGTAVSDYRVYVYPTSGSSYMVDTHSAGMSYTVTGLTNGSSYTFAVSAVNGRGEGPQSGQSAVVTPATVPGPPQNPYAACGNAACGTHWDPPASNGGASIDDYRVTVNPSGGTSYTIDTHSTAVDYQVNGLTNGTSYTFSMAAHNWAGWGSNSGNSVASTPDVAQNAPGAPSATGGQSQQVPLSWTAPSPSGGTAIDSYRITVYPSGGSSYMVDTGSSGTSYTVTGLTNGTSYQFSVMAHNGAGFGAASAMSNSAVPDLAPNAPGQPSAIPGNSQVALSWSAPSSNAGSALRDYIITVYPSGGSSYTIDTQSTSTSYTVTGLTNGTSYTFAVAAKNTLLGPNSPQSNPVTPHVPPTITKSVAASSYSRGDYVSYTITVTNPASSATSLPVTQVVDVLDPGLQGSPGMPITATVNGTNCATSSPITCTVTGGATVMVAEPDVNHPITLAPGGQIVVKYLAVALGSDRQCSAVPNSAYVDTNIADHVPATPVAVTVCQAGLGTESWWSYVTRVTGPQGTAAVNVANGNLVVSQTDTQVVQAHGRLAYVLRRTYNSQENTAVTLPGSIGAGWMFNIGQADDLAGDGVTATGLYIPSGADLVQQAQNPLGVTYIDRDGTRHVFKPRLIPAVSVNTVSGTQSVLTPLALPSSPPDPTYASVQVDQVFDPPPGVHLALWRYVEVSSDGSSKKVIGYGAERTDRLRYEFSADGRLLSMTDPSGVELRYVYETNLVAGALQRLVQVYEPRSCTPGAPQTSPALPLPSSCRRFDIQYSADNKTVTVWDPSGDITSNDSSGRPTRYHLDGNSPVSHLTSVDNPDGSHLYYAYGGCGGTADQLCSVTDPRGNTTSFTYASNPIVGALPVVNTMTERRTTQTSFTYALNGSSTTVDRGSERQRFSSIDGTGRVGQLDEGDTSGSNRYQHTTQYAWDTSSTTCRQPNPAVDNNLCRVVRYYMPGTPSVAASATPGRDDDTYYLYNLEGALLLQRRNLSAANPTPGTACGHCQDTTYGYHIQYVQGSGSSQQYDDQVNGAGYFVQPFASRPSGTNSLFPIYDKTQQLTARGNDPSVATDYPCSATTIWKCYLTSYLVENNAAAAPNAVPTSPATTCGSPGSPTYNTGASCEVDAPSDGSVDGSGNPIHAITRNTYDAFGQKMTMTTPKAIAESLAGQYQYTYYQDAELDLSQNVSAGGWMKATTDPTGAFAFLAYDRAGNVARTWDRNATRAQGTTVATFNNQGGGFAETVHGSGYSQPWRYVLSKTDPLGNKVSYALDLNGNQLAMRPPRGNQAQTANFDITQGFDPADSQICQLQPAEAAGATCASYQSGGAYPAEPANATTNQYDAYGNRIQVTAPTGHQTCSGSNANFSCQITLVQYDAVNRPTTTEWTRGAYDSSNVPTGCRQSTSSDSPLASGSTVCSTVKGYDGVDNVVSNRDASGPTTTYAFDAVHRQVQQLVPRNDGSIGNLRTDTAYDLDGHVVDLYPPRAFSEGPQSAFDTHSAYDPAGRLTSVQTHRSASQIDTTQYTHDADGNVLVTTDPNGHTTTDVYSVLDRKTSETVPHSSCSCDDRVTQFGYDLVGNKTSSTAFTNGGATGTSLITAYAFDADNRLTDTVTGADSTTAASAGVGDGTKNVRQRQFYDADGHQVAVLDPRAFTASTGTPSSSPYLSRTDYDVDGRPVLSWVPYADSSVAPIQAGQVDLGQCPVPHAPAAPGHLNGVPDYPSTTRVCVTQTQYDSAGHASRTILPTSSTVASNPVPNPTDNRYLAFSYTDDGLVNAIDAPSPDTSVSRVTARQTYYDGAGQPVKVVDGLGHATTTSYFDDELVHQTVDNNGPVGHSTSYAYDANGNRITVTDGKAQSTSSHYTNDNLLLDQTDAAGDKTSYTYDPKGQTSTVTSPAANAHDANTNPDGAPTQYRYWFDGLPSEEAVPAKDTSGQLTLVRHTAYVYDSAGRKTQQLLYTTDQNWSQASRVDAGNQLFAYFNDGRMQNQTGRTGSNISYSYDAAGNPLSISDSASGQTLSSTFFLNNLPTSVHDGSRKTTYSYDGSGAIESRIEWAGGAGKATNYNYGDAGLLASMNSDVTSAAYTNLSYDKAGRLTAESDPNGQHLGYTFNGDNTLQQLAVTGSGGANLATWTYTYDQNYQELSQGFSGQGAAAGGGGLVTAALNYQYDAAHRVSSFQQGSTTKAVSYDHNGNRSAYGSSLSWTYNPDNSIATSTDSSAVTGKTLSYAYLTSGGLQDDGCTRYSYDGFDRTTQSAPYTNPSTSRCSTPAPASVSYSYDGLDRQVSRTQAGGSVQVHYDGLKSAVMEELPTSVGGDLNYELMPNGSPKALTQAGTGGVTQYLADDGHGNISTVTNANTATASTAVACTARYDPYGVPLANTAPATGTPPICNTGTQSSTGGTTTTANDFFYRGGRMDVTTGDYQLGSRTYDPTKASFLTPDSYRAGTGAQNISVGVDPLTQNRYSYVNGDPVNLDDPNGHSPCQANTPCPSPGPNPACSRDASGGGYGTCRPGFDPPTVRPTPAGPGQAAKPSPKPSRSPSPSPSPSPTNGICGPSALRVSVANLDISDCGASFIASHEGYCGNLYDDGNPPGACATQPPRGNCTIGYGHLVHAGPCDGRPNESQFVGGITRPEGLQLFKQDLSTYTGRLKRQLGPNELLTQNQFDALTSAEYNLGSLYGPLYADVQADTPESLAKVPGDLTEYVYGNGGQYLAGLKNRRCAEGAIFSAGNYNYHNTDLANDRTCRP